MPGPLEFERLRFSGGLGVLAEDPQSVVGLAVLVGLQVERQAEPVVTQLPFQGERPRHPRCVEVHHLNRRVFIRAAVGRVEIPLAPRWLAVGDQVAQLAKMRIEDDRFVVVDRHQVGAKAVEFPRLIVVALPVLVLLIHENREREIARLQLGIARRVGVLAFEVGVERSAVREVFRRLLGGAVRLAIGVEPDRAVNPISVVFPRNMRERIRPL